MKKLLLMFLLPFFVLTCTSAPSFASCSQHNLCQPILNIMNVETESVCDLSRVNDENNNTKINLLIKLKDENEKDFNITNPDNKLLAAIVFEPSHSKSFKEYYQIKHVSEMAVSDSTDPNYKKFLTTTFNLSPEQFSELKNLYNMKEKGAADDLNIAFYVNETTIFNLVGCFSIRENDPVFK